MADDDLGEVYSVESAAFVDFFSPVSTRHRYLADLDDIPLPADLEPASRSFRANLEAVRAVASLPFRYRFDAHREIYLRDIANRIRVDDPKLADDQVLALTMKKWDDGFAKKEFQATFVKELLDRLILDRRDPEFVRAFDHIHRQAAVMTWTAAETIAQDVFRATLNGRPDVASRFLRSQEAKKLFDIESKKKEVWEKLLDNSLDLSGCIADLLIEVKKIDHVLEMKKVFGALFPDGADLREALDDKNLRILFYRRNLIVHRGAKVDQKYVRDAAEFLADTSDKELREDEILKVSPRPDLENYLHAVSRFGRELLLVAESVFAADFTA